MDFKHIQHRSECFFLPMVLHQSECIIQRSGGFAGSATLEFVCSLGKRADATEQSPQIQDNTVILGASYQSGQ